MPTPLTFNEPLTSVTFEYMIDPFFESATKHLLMIIINFSYSIIENYVLKFLV